MLLPSCAPEHPMRLKRRLQNWSSHPVQRLHAGHADLEVLHPNRLLKVLANGFKDCSQD